MNEKTQIVFAKYYLEDTSPRYFADWAVSLLEEKYDSKNIRILASMFNAKAHSDVEIYVRKSLEDLNWGFPDKEKCLLNYSKEIARQIVENEMAPVEGCRKIYEICWNLDYSNKLHRWIYLDEGLDPETYDFLYDSYENAEPTEALKKAIIKEANELLKEGYFERSEKERAEIIASANQKKTKGFFEKIRNLFS